MLPVGAAGSRIRGTSMGGLYVTATLLALLHRLPFCKNRNCASKGGCANFARSRLFCFAAYWEHDVPSSVCRIHKSPPRSCAFHACFLLHHAHPASFPGSVTAQGLRQRDSTTQNATSSQGKTRSQICCLVLSMLTCLGLC